MLSEQPTTVENSIQFGVGGVGCARKRLLNSFSLPPKEAKMQSSIKGRRREEVVGRKHSVMFHADIRFRKQDNRIFQSLVQPCKCFLEVLARSESHSPKT